MSELVAKYPVNNANMNKHLILLEPVYLLDWYSVNVTAIKLDN